MGIKGLNKFLRDVCPHVFQEIELKDLAYKKCAIDVSLYIYKYMAIFGTDGWMSAFINLVICLKKNNIHSCFIFDNGCPEEKLIERQRRKDSRGKIDNKVERMENEIIEYYSSGVFTDFLEKIYTTKCIENKRSPKRLLSQRKVSNDEKIKKIEEELERINKQSITVTETDIQTLKAFLDLIKVPYFNAILEGETTCVDLCIQGKVDFVITEDSDVFAYGCPLVVKDVNTSTGKCQIVVYDDIISSLEIERETFLDFCIMSGTDYNSNIPLVGPIKSFAFMKEYKNIENFLSSGKCTKDASELNYEQTRKLFTEYKRVDYIIPYSENIGEEDFQKITTFLFVKNINYDINKIKKCYSN